MTIQQVIDRILNYSTGEMRISPTCDQLIAGDPSAEVTGIVVTFMATVDVVRKAAEVGANFIITHEPTWFSGKDTPDWCSQDSVYLAKRRLLDETGVTIWRYHDHMHAAGYDLIYKGMEQTLGWSCYRMPSDGFARVYDIPPCTLEQLAAQMKQTLHMEQIQVIGNAQQTVRRALLLVGGGSLGLGVEEMPMQVMEKWNCDVMLCGDITEWTTCAYIRDAVQLGMNKSMVKLGHNRSEEGGMEYMTQWLPDLIDHCCPVQFVESGEPFSYL